MFFHRMSMLLSVLFVFLISLSACSVPEEQEKEGIIEHTTKAISTEAINRIETPIDKATEAKELLESHYKQ